MNTTPERAYELLRERAGRAAEAPARPSEIEWQARLYGGELGVAWTGEDGEQVEILHFGTWNREAGPDFCGAKVVIDGRELRGDIEIDRDARDWDNHGHGANPAFRQVVLHLFFQKGRPRFFTRTAENRAVTQVCLGGAAARRPSGVARPGGPLDAGRAGRLIEAAARFRLKRKQEGLARAARLRGRDEALFEGVATGLGYKNNKIPFLLAAQRAGLARARAKDGESLLFGLGGFLEAEYFDRGGAEARVYLRGLWETWWKISARETRLVVPADAWKMSALRPANHPHRRMGALAAAAREFSRLADAVDRADAAGFCGALERLDHPFWRSHFSLACEALPGGAALVGEDRARDIAINTFFPALPFETAWRGLANFAGPAPSKVVLSTLAWLAGAGARDLRRSALHQQGLLQLHADFAAEDPGALWETFATA